jgi:hypothetical protein
MHPSRLDGQLGPLHEGCQRLWNGAWKVGFEAAFSGSVVMVCLANTHSMKADVQERSLERA